MLNSFHPAAVERAAVYVSLNGAESPRAAEEGRLWIEPARIPTMFQFRPTSRRFSVFVCASVCCWHGRLEWNDVRPSGNRGIFSSSALSFPKPLLMLPEEPSLDDNKD